MALTKHEREIQASTVAEVCNKIAPHLQHVTNEKLCEMANAMLKFYNNKDFEVHYLDNTFTTINIKTGEII